MDAENTDMPGSTAGAEEEVTPLFAAFKPKPKPAPRPAPAPVQAKTEAPAPKPRQEPEKPQALPAMEARLAELEKKLRQNAAPAPENEALEYLKTKVGELEAKLRESQEKGLAFAFELKGREESRKESRREMEELLATMKQQQSAAETERLRLEEIGKSRTRIEALEKRLLDLAADAKAPKQDPVQQERLKALFDRMELLEKRSLDLAADAKAPKQDPVQQERLKALFDRMELLEKRSLDLAADAKAPKQDPVQQERLKALFDRMESIEARALAQERRLDEVFAGLKAGEENSHKALTDAAERIRAESAGILVIKLRELRESVLEESERIRLVPGRIEKSASAMTDALAARLAELREAVALLSDTAATASIGGDKAFEWVKETLEKKGRTAVDYAAGAYDIGFIQASLDNLEKSLASALETVSRTSQAPEETALPPETRARRGATALAEAMKKLGDALDNFRHMRFEITKKIRKTLTGD